MILFEVLCNLALDSAQVGRSGGDAGGHPEFAGLALFEHFGSAEQSLPSVVHEVLLDLHCRL